MEPASEKSTNRGNATEPARDGSLIRSPGQSDGSPVGRRQISISTSDQSTIPSSSDIHLKDSLLSDTSRSSQHADIIDRLDFTGVGTMFHHDGPFDALAPSRNRLRIKAPILAWGSSPSEEASRFPGNNFSSSPEPYRRTYQKKQVRTVASTFWGIGEPEPYEEFFAGESTVDHDSGSRQEIPNTNTETRLKSAGSCMKGDAGTINTRELSGQDGDPTSESLKASHRKTSTADQAEAIQRARDRNHETSSVGNILDTPATTAPGARASDQYGGSFERDIPEGDQGVQGEAISETVSESLVIRTDRIFQRVQTLYKVVARSRRSRNDTTFKDKPKDLGTAQGSTTAAPRPGIVPVPPGLYKDPVAIDNDDRARRWHRKKDKMDCEDWLRLEEEKERQRLQADPSTSETCPDGHRDGSSSGGSCESYHASGSKIWNWLCFKCPCLCC